MKEREFTMKRDSNRRFRYNKGSYGGGMCFTISWERFSDLLKGRDDYFVSRLHEDEYVDRFEVGEEGVVVFIEKYPDANSPGIGQRY
jgi:hypothetical protein